jgi:predicted nucleic acid-binding protein
VIVANTNLICYLLIDGDNTESARRIYSKDPDWHVPHLWRSEFLNVLAVSVQVGVITRTQAEILLPQAIRLFSSNEHEPGAEATLATAIDSHISAYDAQFVTVARHLKCPLITWDKKILTNCPTLAISPSTF